MKFIVLFVACCIAINGVQSLNLLPIPLPLPIDPSTLIKPVMDQLAALIKTVTDLLAKVLDTVNKLVADLLKQAANLGQGALDCVGPLADNVTTLENNAIKQVQQIIADQQAQLDAITKKSILDLPAALLAFAGNLPAILNQLTGIINGAQTDLMAVVAQIQKCIPAVPAVPVPAVPV